MSIRHTLGRLSSAAAVCLAMGGLATPAHAILLNGTTEVGSLDTLLCSAQLANSGDNTEMTFIRNCAGDQTLTLDEKINTNVFDIRDNAQGISGFNVSPDTPGYFLLKFGAGQGQDPTLITHHVFRNESVLTWLIFSDAQLLGAGLPFDHLLSISHYVYTDGGTLPPNRTPEPASLALAGIALLGLALSRRRKS